MYGCGSDDLPANQRVAFRLSTAADIDAYYGSRPPQTVRALTLTLDHEPAAIIGLSNEGGYLKLFSEYKPGFRPYLRSMTTLRAIKAMMTMIEQSALPVVAITQLGEPDSSRVLERLGFECYGITDEGDLYEWRG